ncbi:hypothetical protein C9374_009524 [Naegleria lovaniensis]|uniref:F-box domain-containing protein n=1 Tax=Naegleria lovaniensis TaxID=51637 RepID=A0AA88KR59_NAELO|nr:uncharacterized protein C9374_009524 [Naegleria lovaniensis]KAG2392947.1 hypothetical protein C9374_009524 [Naegleria lovaniensis]
MSQPPRPSNISHTLPPEIICEVMVYALDPHALISSISRMRHVSRSWFGVTESRVFWQLVVEACRPPRPNKRDCSSNECKIITTVKEDDALGEVEQENVLEQDEMEEALDDDDAILVDIYNEEEDILDENDDNRWEDLEEALPGTSSLLETLSESYSNPTDSEEDCNSYNSFHGHFFKTHEFIDTLLHQTQFNKFYFLNDQHQQHPQQMDGFLGFRMFLDDKSYMDPTPHDDDPSLFLPKADPANNHHETVCSLFHEKVVSWIDAFGMHDHGENVLLKALLEISLGHETIEYLGMRNMGTCVQAFFHKLFEPAMLLVREWFQISPNNSKPKEINPFTAIRDTPHTSTQELFFNKNLLQFLKDNNSHQKEQSIFKQDIGGAWNDHDSFYHVIPRQYLLFMIEHFTNMNVVVNREGDTQDVVTFVMEQLYQCGLHVENVIFHDLSLHLRNFERTEALRRIIPPMSSGFYLQHLAVWTQNLSLLHWCLTVNNKDCHAKIVDVLTPKASFSDMIPRSLTFQSYLRTCLQDSCGLTILHYAVAMRSLEFVRVLLNHYFCHPFIMSNFKESPLSLAYKISTHHVGKTKNNVEQAMLDLFTQRYQLPETCLTETETNVTSCPKLNDDEKLITQRQEVDSWYNISTGEWQEREDDLELNVNKVVEKHGELKSTEFSSSDDEENCYYESDEFEYEECISLDWMKKQIKNFSSQTFQKDTCSGDHNVELDHNESEQCHSDENEASLTGHDPNSLKRKRHDPVYREFGPMEDFTEYFEELISNFEQVEKEEESSDFYPTCRVKILERTFDSNKKQKLSDPNVLINRGNYCIIPKRPFNRCVNEIGQYYRAELLFMPHAKMMLQQHTESVTRRVFELASHISLFMGYDHVTTEFVLAANMILSQHSVPSQRMGHVVEMHLKEVSEGNHVSKHLHDMIASYDMDLLTLITMEDDVEGTIPDDDYDSSISTCSDDSCTSITALCFALDRAEGFNDSYSVYADNPTKQKQYAPFIKKFTGSDGYERSAQVEVHRNSLSLYVHTNERDLAVLWADGHLDDCIEHQRNNPGLSLK